MTEKETLADRVKRMVFDPAVPDWAFITEEEVCAFFSCKPSTLFDWKRDGGFPPASKIPGGVCYPLSAVREYLKKTAATAKKTAVAVLASQK